MAAAYMGTEEEKKLKSKIRNFEYDLKNRYFVNSIINSCNAMTGVPFNFASVELQEHIDHIDFVFFGGPSPQSISLRYEDIIDTQVLFDFAKEGVRSLSKQYEPIFSVLLDFTHNLDFHQKAIDRVLGSEEADIMVVLALHLFAQLVPNNSVELDDMSTVSNKCPCSCGKNTVRRCTSLGSVETWHGNADIIVDQRIPVVFMEKKKLDMDFYDNDEEDTESEEAGPSLKRKYSEEDRENNLNDNDSESDKVGPSRKKRKNDEKCHVCPLHEYDVLGQVISQTITNAFIQVKNNKSLSGQMIPTFACSSEEVCLFLYDPEEDILLHGVQDRKLWVTKSILNFDTVLFLWLFLNFTSFVKPNIAQYYKLERSRFHRNLGGHLKYYKLGKSKERFLHGPKATYDEIVVPYMSKYMKRAERILNT